MPYLVFWGIRLGVFPRGILIPLAREWYLVRHVSAPKPYGKNEPNLGGGLQAKATVFAGITRCLELDTLPLEKVHLLREISRFSKWEM